MKKSQNINTSQNNCNYLELLGEQKLSKETQEKIIQIYEMPNEQIQIQDTIIGLLSEQFFEQHKVLIMLRRTLFNLDQGEMLTQERKLIPLLLHVIEYGSTYILRLEAIWIISILTGGRSELTPIVVENGIIPLALKVLKWNKSELTMRMIQILGKLAADSVKYRDAILSICGIERIISLMEPKYEATYIWCLANLCIGRPSPPFQTIQPAFKIFVKIVMSDSTNFKTINDAIWALGYMIDGDSKKLNDLIQYGIVPQLIHLLPVCNVVSILRIFEQIFYGTEDQIQHLLESGFTSWIRVVLDPKSREDAGGMIQTFAATETLFKVVSNQNFLMQLFKSLCNNNSNLRGDGLEVIGKAVQHGTNDDIHLMVQNKLIYYILQMLESSNKKEISSQHQKKGLEILIKVLRKGEQMFGKQKNRFLTAFIELHGADVIEMLLSSKQDDVAKYASIFKQEFTI